MDSRGPGGVGRRSRISMSRCRCHFTAFGKRSEEHTSELQSHSDLVCRLLPEKKKYRLPTEAEWEYACRGGVAGQVFRYGHTLSSSQANFDGRKHYGVVEQGDHLERNCQVGSY